MHVNFAALKAIMHRMHAETFNVFVHVQHLFICATSIHMWNIYLYVEHLFMKAIMHRMHAEAFKALLRHLRPYTICTHTQTHIYMHIHIYIYVGFAVMKMVRQRMLERLFQKMNTPVHIYTLQYIYIYVVRSDEGGLTENIAEVFEASEDAVCVFFYPHKHTYTHACIYIRIYIYLWGLWRS